jgi:NAD(P)-dependent dehydrogenase (short-subunit alcohol dehydrogenase family)
MTAPSASVFRDDCLAGRTIFVTGASSGIGRSAAVALSRCGARLVLNGRSEERLADSLALLAGAGHAAAPGALTDADSTADLVKAAARDHGPFHAIFHAAGNFAVRAIKMTKQAQLDDTFNASVFGAYGVGRAAASPKVLADGGSLLLMSSVAAWRGNPALAAYSGAKAAVLGLTRVLALELAPRRVRVNAVVASTITTEMHWKTLENADMTHVDANEARHPLGFGSPEQMNDAVLFLLSDASTWITGAEIAVDGGYSAG